VADMRGRPCIPRPNRDASGLREHVIIAIGYLAKLGDRFGELRRSAAYRIAVPWSAL
jgi:hypothetical protein